MTCKKSMPFLLKKKQAKFTFANLDKFSVSIKIRLNGKLSK